MYLISPNRRSHHYDKFRLPTVSAVIPTIVVQIFLQIEVDCAAQSPALLQSSFLEMKYDSVFWML